MSASWISSNRSATWPERGGRSYELTGTRQRSEGRVDILHLIDEAESGRYERFREAKADRPAAAALAKDPENPSLYYQLGGRLEKNDRYDEASQLYRTALSKGIDSGRLHSRIADLLIRRGEKDRAIAEYEKAAQINPADLDSQNNLATAYLEKGRLADAERVFKWILTNDPELRGSTERYGTGLNSEAGSQAARGYFERAVRLDPDLVEAHMNLGILYEMAGSGPARVRSFETLSGESVSGSVRADHSREFGRNSRRFDRFCMAVAFLRFSCWRKLLPSGTAIPARIRT